MEHGSTSQELCKYNLSTVDIFGLLWLKLQRQLHHLQLVGSDTDLRIRARRYSVNVMKPSELIKTK